ncbi:hypothetical protein H9X96_12965 [Pedobacter sp. N36a]|uniref:hypothetical protein n=1 Tax=Pedobacter sp. N36a TaxID=2767996 RepID=UPI001656E6B0|nr:hypothetical protein [Pedobacter sp. N36a]MBC8986688.1 hypothetical protein [Pedobacter sp. N36a]
MNQPTVVTSNSIQNRRVTESGKPVDINKTFSYYIHELKKEDHEYAPTNIDAKEEQSKNVFVSQDRLEALGDISFKEHYSYYTLTQRWLGTIIELNENGFIAKLEDLNSGGTFEYADFFNTEVSKDDKPLVKYGGVFYWSLGYANDKGSVKKESIIRFQRLPEWSIEEIDSAIDKSRLQNKSIKWL